MPEWKVTFIVRCTQCVLCLICLIISIVVFTSGHFFMGILTVLFTVASAFLFLTAIDIISWICKRPIGFLTWVMVATAGFLMCCLSCGVVVPVMKAVGGVSIFAFIMFLFTAIAFLLELFYMIMNNKRLDPYFQLGPSQVGVVPSKTHHRGERPERLDKSTSAVITHHREERQVVRKDEEIDATRPTIYKYCLTCGEGRRRHQQQQPPHTKHGQIPITYGGTFSVSKDAAPLHPCNIYRRCCIGQQTKYNQRNMFVENCTSMQCSLGVGTRTSLEEDPSLNIARYRNIHPAGGKRSQTTDWPQHRRSPRASPRYSQDSRRSTIEEVEIPTPDCNIDLCQDETPSKENSTVIVFESPAMNQEQVESAFAVNPERERPFKKVVAEVITQDGSLRTFENPQTITKTLYQITTEQLLPGQAKCTYRMKCCTTSDSPVCCMKPERLEEHEESKPIVGTEREEERRRSGGTGQESAQENTRTVAVTARLIKKTE